MSVGSRQRIGAFARRSATPGIAERRAIIAARLPQADWPGRDLRLELKPTELGWAVPAKVDAGNDWNVTLQDGAGQWRIVGRLRAGEHAVRLAPALAPQ